MNGSSPRFRMRLLALYVALAVLSTACWLTHDFSAAGVPHLAFAFRLRCAAISLTGPFAMSLVDRLDHFRNGPLVLALNVAAVALGLAWPSYGWTRWLGYAGIVWWILYGTAVAYIPF